jgi:hypothetical protein
MKARTFLTAALALFATAGTCPRPASAGYIPIVVSGFNQDVVVEAGAVNDPTTHFAGAITATMDTGTAKTFNTWYESGLPGGAGGGLPAAGVFTSAADPTAQFLLAPYTGPNVLLLDDASKTGTLTLATPASFTALSILTSSGLGSATSPVLGLTVHFSDGTTPLSGLAITAPDWFNQSPAALIARGRVNVNTGVLDSVGSDNPRIYQENVPLPADAAGHPISSITFTWSASGSTLAQTAIFAISGAAVPEPSSAALLGTGVLGLALLAVRRRRVSRVAR